MFDDRNLRRCRVFVLRPAPLKPLTRIAQRIKIALQTTHNGGITNGEARLVHHVEHIGHAAPRLTDQCTDGITAFGKIDQAIGDAALAHFVIKACKRDVVPGPKRAVVVDAIARYEKKRDAFDARCSARNFREHHVDDVVGELVIAARNPHLRTDNAIRPVAQGFRAGRDVGERGARLRLGETHGPEPAPFEHRRQINAMLFRRAEGAQHIGVGDREEAVVPQAQIGAGEDPVRKDRHHHRQLKPAIVLIENRGEKSRVRTGGERFADPGDGLNTSVHEFWLVRVHRRGERVEIFFGDGFRAVEHRADRAAVMRAKARHLEKLLKAQHFIEQKIDIAALDELGHLLSSGAWGASGRAARPLSTDLS